MTMSRKTKAGVAMICLGVLLVVLGGLKFNSRTEVLRVADFRATVTAEKKLPALRYAGIALVAAGGLLIVGGYRRSHH